MTAMSETYNLTVDESNAAKRLDKIVVDLADGITRSAAQRLIDGGNVTVNGETKNKNYISRLGDEIGVTVPDAVPLEAKAENIPLDIVYEDDDLLVVNKPKGMVVHPANGNWEGTLVNAHHPGRPLPRSRQGRRGAGPEPCPHRQHGGH